MMDAFEFQDFYQSNDGLRQWAIDFANDIWNKYQQIALSEEGYNYLYWHRIDLIDSFSRVVEIQTGEWYPQFMVNIFLAMPLQEVSQIISSRALQLTGKVGYVFDFCSDGDATICLATYGSKEFVTKVGQTCVTKGLQAALDLFNTR